MFDYDIWKGSPVLVRNGKYAGTVGWLVARLAVSELHEELFVVRFRDGDAVSYRSEDIDLCPSAWSE